MQRTFRNRVDPFETYISERSFRQRFRLSKPMVEELAEGFGRSEWATKGQRNSGGLSHRERVSACDEMELNDCKKKIKKIKLK